MSQRNSLHLSFVPDEDGLGRLSVTVSSDGFSGKATVWIGEDRLQKFLEDVRHFPIQADEPAVLESWFNGKEPNYQDLLVQISPLTSAGAILVLVHLATEVWKDADKERLQEVTARFLVVQSDIDRFVAQLGDVMAGVASEAILESFPN